jgi:AcrR family transcriptional regulator
MKIADAEGLDAVSIRRVASDLGVRPMSLYTYIDRKEDLFDLMLDRAASGILFRNELPRGWRDALTAIARRTREVMLRHRWMADINVHNAAVGPNALRHVEESISAITELGLSPLATTEVLTAVDKFVLGHVIFELGSHSGLAEQAYVQALLASGEFPRLAQVAAAAKAAGATGGEFERGLAWLLDGIEAQFGS